MVNKTVNFNKNAVPVVFRKWQSKSYSAFNSLHKIVKIGSLSLAYSLVLVPKTSDAQDVTSAYKTDGTEELEEIVVSATRAEEQLANVARVVSVVSREEIGRVPVQSIQDLLDYVLNVDVRQRGNHGVQADVSIRGGSSDQIMIMLNGVNINDPQTGHHNLNLPVDLQSIERIEVLEGGAARVHGPSAYTGAINIITKSGGPTSVEAFASYGEHNLYNVGANVGVSAGPAYTYLAVNRKHSDGYIENTDFDNTNVYFRQTLKAENHAFDIQLGLNKKDFGAQGFYTSKYAEYEETQTTFGSISHRTGKTVKLISSLYWRNHHDHFVLIRDMPQVYQNFHQTDVYGFKTNASYANKLGVSSAGLELRSENIASNSLGESTGDTIKVPWHDDGYFYRSSTRNRLGLFAEHNYKRNRFHASGGLYFDLISDLSVSYRVYPGLDLSYWLGAKTKVYTSVSQSMRMPTFHEIYYSSPVNIGNANLQPEKNTSVELGVKGYFTKASYYVTMFYRKQNNVIDWYKDSINDATWEANNFGHNQVFGISYSEKFYVDKWVDFYMPLKVLQFGSSWMHIDNSGSDYISKYILDYVRASFQMSASFEIYNNIGLNYKIRWQDRAGTFIKVIDGVEVDERRYKPYWLMDTRLYYQHEMVYVYAEASNIFDKQYVDIGNVVQPGRWISVGAKVTLTRK